jgi:hypothetical protein
MVNNRILMLVGACIYNGCCSSTQSLVRKYFPIWAWNILSQNAHLPTTYFKYPLFSTCGTAKVAISGTG